MKRSSPGFIAFMCLSASGFLTPSHGARPSRIRSSSEYSFGSVFNSQHATGTRLRFAGFESCKLEATRQEDRTMPNEAEIREALKDIYDPEIPVNIVDLGLLYGVAQEGEGGEKVNITMTLTTPGCGMGAHIAQDIK